MPEIEVPTEHLHEHIHHHAEHGGEKWISWVALSTAILAVFAAVAALLAGKYANEALIDQLHASDQWAYYQAKGIKSIVIESKANATEADKQRVERYTHEQEEIKKEAEEKQHSSMQFLHTHETLAGSVTFFQIAIAVAAVSALTKKRRFWIVSLVLGAGGIVIGVSAFLHH